MNLAQLRAFHAVANHSTFSAAAQALGVSQSAITQHVKSLEDAVGTRLFLRSAGGVELTADALDLLPKVRQAILMLDDIATRMNEGRVLATGHLGAREIFAVEKPFGVARRLIVNGREVFSFPTAFSELPGAERRKPVDPLDPALWKVSRHTDATNEARLGRSEALGVRR